MLTMYDALTIENIPSDATVVAGYINGHKYAPNYNALCHRFPNARHLSIATIIDEHSDGADILDSEDGNVGVDQVPGWIRRRQQLGVARPCVYMSVDPMRDTLLPRLKREGIALSSVRLWSADYTNHEHICGPHSCGKISVTVDGTQFTETAHGLSLDQSILNDNFFDEPKPPTMYPCQGHKSLEGLSQQLNNAPSTMLRLTAENSPGRKFYPGIAGYINEVFAADKEKVPKDTIVYYPAHPTDPTPKASQSHGDQTLQGLALTFGCKPADIVQYTAENSPGEVFTADMAKYLNDVFSRSDTHVPSGAHLFYEK